MIYFKKELPHNRINDSKGRQIPFDILNDSIGLAVFDLDDPVEFEYIDSLRQMAQAGRGGVIELTEQEFSAEKKKSSLTPSKRQPKQSAVRALRPVSPYRQRQNVEAAEETAKQTEKAASDKTFGELVKDTQKSAKTDTPTESKETAISENQSTSSVETDAAPWDSSEDSPRTATVKSNGDSTDIQSNEGNPQAENMARG